MIPALTPYISRYYDDWRRGSRRWCSFLGILPYADDVLSDVLESLCRRPEAFQFDLLAREQAGERPLLFYVFGALRTEAILYAQKYRVTCSIERFPQLKENDDGSDQEVSAEPFAAFREVEAIFRSDDFIDESLQYGGHGRLYRYVTRRTGKHSFYPMIKYQVHLPDGSRRQFSRRSSAIAFLAGQNPPPGNRTGNQLKRTNNNLLTNR